MLGQLIEQADQLTIIDMEASVEHMSRGTVRHVDTMLVVTEPYYRSLETAGRMAPLAHGLGIPRVYAIANKIRDERDEAAVLDYCNKHDIQVVARVPFDPAVTESDLAGRPIIDHNPNSPAVAELRRLADWLEENARGG